MRVNFRARIRNYTLFFMVSHTQKLHGITSKIPQDKLNRHYVFADIENCDLITCEKELLSIQRKYNLPHIFITSDKDKSFRIWCFARVEFRKLLKILLDIPHLDYNFFYWTVERGKATLRTSIKLNRHEQKIIGVLESYSVPVPEYFQEVVYETGTDKIGIFKEFQI